MANDLLSALRTYLSKVSSGDKNPQELAAALNTWARESGDAIKARVEEEIARSAKKMGFAKQSDLDALAKEVSDLRSRVGGSSRSNGKVPTPKKAPVKSAAKKKTSPKKQGSPKSRAKKGK